MSASVVQVIPMITDPNMQNSKTPKPSAAALLRELGAEHELETEDMKKTVFEGQPKTKEEQGAEEPKQGMSTMLIIVFAVVVIALVALIVWMVLKQNDPKKEEDEAKMRALIQHQQQQRNNMPTREQYLEMMRHKQQQVQSQPTAPTAQTAPQKPKDQPTAPTAPKDQPKSDVEEILKKTSEFVEHEPEPDPEITTDDQELLKKRAADLEDADNANETEDADS